VYLRLPFYVESTWSPAVTDDVTTEQYEVMPTRTCIAAAAAATTTVPRSVSRAGVGLGRMRSVVGHEVAQGCPSDTARCKPACMRPQPESPQPQSSRRVDELA